VPRESNATAFYRTSNGLLGYLKFLNAIKAHRQQLLEIGKTYTTR
jgi:hypothetical protein